MPAGRPTKKIDIEMVKKLSAKQWTIAEMAAFFQVHRTTLERKFSAVIAEGRENGRAKLRDVQWQRALAGSDRVLIHMCKHYLDQHDKQRIELEKVTDDILEQEIKRRLSDESPDKGNV